MSSGTPTSRRIVLYFFLISLILAFTSHVYPATSVTVQEIPRSPLWSDPVVVGKAPSLTQIPQMAVDLAGRVHILYVAGDKSTDIYYTQIEDSEVTEPRNLTTYPSLKESVCVSLSSQLYIAFLDNREGNWQVFLLNVSENALMQLTHTDTYKEDVFLSSTPDKSVVTWTEFERGTAHLLMSVVDAEGVALETRISENGWKGSTFVDDRIHVLYLEKHGYDHIIYKQLDFSGNTLLERDLGECIHADLVGLTLDRGPQLIVSDMITCVWSDSRTGSPSLYYAQLTREGDLATVPVKLQGYFGGMWAWMPSCVSCGNSIHLVYVSNGFGVRLYHATLTPHEELGTVTSQRERGTSPFVVCDAGGYLHCVYLRFRDDGNVDVVYRNTHPSVRIIPFLEKMRESSIEYVYSLVLSFLFSFPLTVKDNFWGLLLVVGGFFGFRFFNVKEIVKGEKMEYVLLFGGFVMLSALRGNADYSYMAPVMYGGWYVVYGFCVSFLAAFLFRYLLKDRFDVESRVLLGCLVFLYYVTLVLVLPVVPHI